VKGWKWIGAALVWGVATSPVRGETWADWQGAPENAPVRAEFQTGWVVEPEQRSTYSEAEDYVEPNRGYEGTLVFWVTSGVEAPKGPLTVHLLHSVAPPGDMNWPEGDDLPTNFIPKVLPQAAPRRAVSEETWTLPAEFPLRVPVILPRNCQAPMSFRNRKPAALFVRYEVADASGRLLCRGMLPARKLSEDSRSLAGMANADEALEQVAKDLGSLARVGDLPDEMAAYRQVRGIWFTESLWQKMEGREALLRRLLLSGVRLSGETALVERIRGALGTGKDGQAVSESVEPGNWCSKGEFSLRELDLYPSKAEADREEHERSGPKKSVLDNQVNLFKDDLDSYLAWTLAGLLVFTAGVAAILGVVFIRFKGERRVAIWWTLPAWTVLCFASIWAGGTLVLERKPRVDVTEYRLAMAGWPEMHCRAVATAMTFESGRPEWTLPAGAAVHGRRYERLDGWWMRDDAKIAAEGIRLRLPRRPTGSALELEAGWFEPASLPLVPEDGTVDAPGRRLVAVMDVDAVYVLAEGEWRELGALKAGDRIDPLAAKKVEGNVLSGLPSALDDELSQWEKSNPCRNPAHHHPVEAESPPLRHDWVVVALKRDVPPRVAPMWEDSLTKGRVIWVMQCP